MDSQPLSTMSESMAVEGGLDKYELHPVIYIY
jgi:hypothetical protein